ncbi:phage baseplate assembly protein V [Kribbella sp. NBC_00482]|uniref:phage baseplate assembly protein V n=1 Tax=Kribbella sp. NBC_00482 TaxID=2975968 RepID=UPI002E180702
MRAPPYAPRFDVRLSGVTLAADLADQVLSLTVESDLDLAGSFSLSLRNHDNALLDSALLDVGKTVEIHLGYAQDLVPAFLGEIASIEPSFPADGPPTITVSGYDKSYRLRHTQPEPRAYGDLNDSLIAAQIAAENGLTPIVDPVPFHADRVQVETDMAFLKACAAQYFFDVYVEWDRLHFHFPRPQLSAHTLEWGKNLSSFSPRISATGLAGVQQVRVYNQELAQALTVTMLAADLDADNLVERLGSSAAQLLMSFVRKGIRRQAIGNPVQAAAVAKAILSNLLEGTYEGSGSCIGIPDLSAGRYVTIAGVGKRFSGTYRLRKVTHRIDGNGFRTDFSITQSGHSSLLGLLRKKLVEAPSPNQAEKFYGVVLGVVEDNNELAAATVTPAIGRVKVSFPGLADTFKSGWAPCVRPMAGDGTGFYALPDKGDQVLVAFEHGELSKPYVLGALWTALRKPPADNADGQNTKKVLKSKAGHTITFDDTAGGAALTISAAGDLSIKATGQITLAAAGGSTAITLADDGVDVT